MENIAKTESRNKIFIKANYQLVSIYTDEILYIKSLSDYVVIKTINGKYITLSTLKDTMKTLPENQFVQCHRSFIVRLEKIDRVEKTKAIVPYGNELEFKIPIGPAYEESFMTAFNTRPAS